jgi:hypothetical protein
VGLHQTMWSSDEWIEAWCHVWELDPKCAEKERMSSQVQWVEGLPIITRAAREESKIQVRWPEPSQVPE